MQEPDLVLEFEIEEGRSPDLEKVAKALLAWNEAVQASFAAIAPYSSVKVELVGVEHGSQRFKQVFRFLENQAEALEQGGQEFPLIFKHAKALAKLIAGGILVAVITNEVVPDEHLAVLEEMRDILREDAEVRRHSQEFYETLQEEPSIEVVEVYEGGSATPVFVVPRDEFAYKSGFFQMDADPTVIEEEEERYKTWDVVLIRPVLVGKPRRWTFEREGLEFSALMADPAVLEAIRTKSLEIPFAEGVMMKIEVSYKERFDGNAWRPIAKSRKVVRVLSPRISLPPGALFAVADRP